MSTADTETLDQVWARAEAEFPAAERFGIDLVRHPSGFYIGQISKRWVNDAGDDGPFHILSYQTEDTPSATLSAAIDEARRSLTLGIDWIRKDLPKAA